MGLRHLLDFPLAVLLNERRRQTKIVLEQLGIFLPDEP